MQFIVGIAVIVEVICRPAATLECGRARTHSRCTAIGSRVGRLPSKSLGGGGSPARSTL